MPKQFTKFAFASILLLSLSGCTIVSADPQSRAAQAITSMSDTFSVNVPSRRDATRSILLVDDCTFTLVQLRHRPTLGGDYGVTITFDLRQWRLPSYSDGTRSTYSEDSFRGTSEGKILFFGEAEFMVTEHLNLSETLTYAQLLERSAGPYDTFPSDRTTYINHYTATRDSIDALATAIVNYKLTYCPTPE